MNRLSKLAGVPSAPFGEAPATFRFRIVVCESCDGLAWFGIGHGSRCDGCDGTGETDAACCVCGNVTALDGDGYCQYCADENELTTVQMSEKWLCPNVLRESAARVEL